MAQGIIRKSLCTSFDNALRKSVLSFTPAVNKTTKPFVKGIKEHSNVNLATVSSLPTGYYHITNDLITSLQSVSLTSNLSASAQTQLEIKLPSLNKQPTITLPSLESADVVIDIPPSVITPEKTDPMSIVKIEDPLSSQIVEKQAHTMINIRKRKIKVHQRKKRERKMKYVLIKERFLKAQAEEKLFQSEEIARVLDADSFDPEKYAKDLIADSKALPPPPKLFDYYPIHAADYLIQKRHKKLSKEIEDEKKRKQDEIIARVAARNKEN